MDILNIILGVLLILLGFYIAKFYVEDVKKAGLTYKLLTAGICLIIFGVGLILHAFGLIN